ncbi:DnaJ-like protein [Hydrogenivirga caldilitoris]|uniref:DnaJ-like protein n=1 Tax=Hydrogenivirga caldilitoris TaxID=246264 RepID=A0A497XVF9_9AQUI|nr:J domain-containing protein [Hydrogenivirga caldilitoris]RLJ71132.1 DnaJ-like protein [Hydrogenivirga caldilitoris]
MSFFCKKVIEYMYENRLNQFISSFYELYQSYKDLGEERFLREWFHRSIIRSLLLYFPPSTLIDSFGEFESSKGHLLKTYVKTYWSFCRNPKKHPVRIEEAIEFFGLKNLTESELKSCYRKLVRRYHPDRIGKSREAHMTMVKINYYYQILRRYLSDRRNQALPVG